MYVKFSYDEVRSKEETQLPYM